METDSTIQPQKNGLLGVPYAHGDGYVRFETPERPPESPISAQQSPRFAPLRQTPRTYPTVKLEEMTDGNEESNISDINAEKSRSPSVMGEHSGDPRRSPTPEGSPKLAYKPKLILRGHRKGITSVKFSPDGKWIASSCAFDLG
jgi:hypothetical protein